MFLDVFAMHNQSLASVQVTNPQHCMKRGNLYQEENVLLLKAPLHL